MALTKVNSGGITDATIAAVDIANNAVTTDKILNNNVTTDKIQNGGVNHHKIADANVIESKLAANAVTTTKIANDAVTIDKIADNAVGGSQLNSNSVSTAKIEDQAVTLAKLPHGTSSNDGKFLRANNGADPSFESIPAGITVSSQSNNRVITATGTTNTLNAESNVVIDDNGNVGIGHTTPNRLLYLKKSSTATYNSTGEGGGDNHILRIHNPNGTDNTGVNNHTGLEFTVSSGANSFGYLGLVRTGNNQGDFFYKTRIGGTSYKERFRIQNGGGISFNGDTAEANALDDYEEGSASVTLVGQYGGSANYSYRVGYYTRIGRLVHYVGDVRFNGSWSGNSGNVYLQLPFGTSYANGGTVGNGTVAEWNLTNSSWDWVGLTLDNNSANARFVTHSGSNNNTSSLQTGSLGNGRYLKFGLTYITS